MARIKEEDAQRDHASTPANSKRKLADRDLQSDELEHRETRPPPFKDTNGARPSEPSHSAKVAFVLRKRRIYKMPPPWAQSARDRPQLEQSRNAILYRPVAHLGAPPPLVNGKAQPAAPQPSRHASPEERRAGPPPPPAAAAAAAAAATQAPPKPDHTFYGLPGPWEKNLANATLPDTTAAAIADWLFAKVISNPDIEEIESRNVKFEIEAKFGTLVDKQTNTRVALPVATECLLDESDNWLTFKASMTLKQHQFFNKFLNQVVADAHPDNPKNRGPGSQPRVPIEYIHRREIDRFVELTPELRDKYVPACVAKLSRNRGVKVRVTQEAETNKVIARIVKARIADASIFFPHSLDCRISVNLEWDWDGPTDELDHLAPSERNNYRRDKDRVSYKQGFYQVDLTQVKSPPPNPSREHELEVELDAPVIIDQGRRAVSNRPNQYLDIISGFLGNIRLLARQAREHSREVS